jgi:hypothetical protein
MRTTETTATGILLPCPKCGEASASIDFNLADGETLHCQDCDESFEVADVRAFIEKWQPVLSWLGEMPKS